GRGDRARAERLAERVARGGAGLIGVLFLLVALRIWIDPPAVGQTLGIAAQGPVGLATLRADMGGFFGAAGGFALWAAVRRRRVWLLPPLALLTIALAGRALTLAIAGFSIVQVPPMVVEALCVAVLLWAWRAMRPVAALEQG
ncbi:MAG: hypothetical protein AB1760_12375, partial [Pseudomonadota bacterium]